MLVKQQAKVRLLAQAKKTGTLAYLRAVQGVRRTLIALLAAFLALQCMVVAGFGALVTGVMLWDADQLLKLQVLFGLFTFMFGLPFIVLTYLFSQRLWYKVSGAQKLVDDLRLDDAA